MYYQELRSLWMVDTSISTWPSTSCNSRIKRYMNTWVLGIVASSCLFRSSNSDWTHLSVKTHCSDGESGEWLLGLVSTTLIPFISALRHLCYHTTMQSMYIILDS